MKNKNTEKEKISISRIIVIWAMVAGWITVYRLDLILNFILKLKGIN